MYKEKTMRVSKILLLSTAFAVFTTAGYSATNIAAPTAAPAAPAPEMHTSVTATDVAAQFSGLSLGINGGFIHIAADTTWVNHVPGGLSGCGGKYTTTANGGYAGLHAILGRVYPNKFYLGGEVTGAYNFVNGTSRDYINYGKRFRYSIRDSYTAAVRAGMLAGEALVYAKAGLAFTRRNVESQYMLSQVGISIVKSSKYKTGALLGFGFDIPVQKKISCGLEANYVKYGPDSFVHPNMEKYTMHTDTYDFKVKVTFKI